MPPIHPAIVHYPIALVTLLVGADLLAYTIKTASLHTARWWALIGAAVGSAIAVIAGLFDMNREQIGESAHQRAASCSGASLSSSEKLVTRGLEDQSIAQLL